LWRARQFLLYQIIHADDPPHKLALGAAIGMWVTFTPTIGAQMLLVVFLAWLFRANKVVGLPIVWLSNPATLVPIYYPSYRLGSWLLGSPDIGVAWWKQLTDPPSGARAALTFYRDRLLEVFEPLWVGCLIVAALAAMLTYAAVYFAVGFYRQRHASRLQ
jgi:uncharacterized protein (DUF2062 family)